MTKTDINNYLKANADPLSTYSNNQLVPRSRFTPDLPFAFQFYYDEYRGTKPKSSLNVRNVTGWNVDMYFDYQNGKGKLYSPQSNLGSTKTIAGTNITYKVIILPGDASFTLGTSGFEKVMISITNPNKTIGTFTYPVTLYADEAMTEYVTIYFTSTFVNLV